MKFLRKILSLILVTTITTSALFATPLAVEASTETSIDTSSLVLMETTQDTVLRSEPSKNGTVVTNLPADTLVYVTGSTRNSHENVWFEVQYFDQTLYCFSERLTEHEHDYILETSDNPNYAICECGAIKESGLVEQELALATASASLIFAGVIYLYSLICANKDTIRDAVSDLTYTTADVLNTIGTYGVRYIQETGTLMYIRINEAGIAVSVTFDKFREYLKRNQSNNESSDKKYYPAMVLLSTNHNDSIFIPNLSKGMTIDEACDYMDKVLQMNGAFGSYRNFVKPNKDVDINLKMCNIYTVLQPDAKALCEKIVQCGKNQITTYGTSSIKNGGAGLYETNKGRNMPGTYNHYHLHNVFQQDDTTIDEKACPHVFFGDMLTQYKNFNTKV